MKEAAAICTRGTYSYRDEEAVLCGFLTENAERHTFKAPCSCFENAPYTELTIVCTINVSIDSKKNEVSNLNQEKNILDCNTRQSVALFVFCF